MVRTARPNSAAATPGNLLPTLLAAVVVAGCGGRAPAPAAPAADEAAAEAPAAAPAGGPEMISPDVMDQIQRALDRKRAAVARCLAPVVDAKELPRNAHGKVALALVISPSGATGKASSVTVIKSSLESKTLTDCVIGHVQQIEFPAVPRPVEWSYTYAFEAM